MKRQITLVTTMFCLSIAYFLNAQNVGINTNSPQVPLHVEHEDGLTNVDLLMLGENPGEHLLQGVNKIQAWRTATPVDLLLQPDGADVGIGTTTPDARLEIEGSGEQFLRVHTTSQGSSMAGLELLRGSEFNSSDWRIVNDGGKLNFLDGTDNFLTAGELNMTLTQGGNLGLGTDAPQSHLHLSGITDQFLTIHKDAVGAGKVGIDLLRDNEFGATDWRIVNDGGVLKFLDETNNFNTDGEENMRIGQGGNVGIGLIDPQTKLHVNGGEFASMTGAGDMQIGSPTGARLVFDDNEILARNGENPSTLFLQWHGGDLSLANTEDGEVGIGTSPVNDAKVTIQDNNWHLQIENTDDDTNDWFIGASDAGWAAGDDKLVISPNTTSTNAVISMDAGGDVLLIPLEQGQVGIGVSTITNLPASEYLLAVDGKIISEEVRVELSGSWPDYVFDEDYALTSLDKLENEIAALGHLPGIPSAKIIEDEGFELGDMQSRMMEKIEELTLYMIQMNKENKSLRTEVEEYKRLVNKIILKNQLH